VRTELCLRSFYHCGPSRGIDASPGDVGISPLSLDDHWSLYVSHVTSQESGRTNSRFDPVSSIRTIGRRRSPRVGYVSLVNTAQGPVTTTDIGVTLMHEHVFIMTTEIAMNYPEAWGDEDKRWPTPSTDSTS